MLLGRMMSRIVTRWFVLGHEREREVDFSRFSRFEEPIPYFLREFGMWVILQVVFTKLWNANHMKMEGIPLGLIYTTMGYFPHTC
jgi:hypothetical protein